MADWQRKLTLQPEWGQAQAGEISTAQLAAAVANRLRALKPFADDDLENDREELAEEFEAIADDAHATTAEFDDAMHRLYDWGDTRLDGKWNGKAACWIDTH